MWTTIVCAILYPVLAVVFYCVLSDFAIKREDSLFLGNGYVIFALNAIVSILLAALMICIANCNLWWIFCIEYIALFAIAIYHEYNNGVFDR